MLVQKEWPHSCSDIGPRRGIQTIPSTSPFSKPITPEVSIRSPQGLGRKKNPMGLTRHGAPVLVQLKAGAPQPELGNT